MRQRIFVLHKRVRQERYKKKRTAVGESEDCFASKEERPKSAVCQETSLRNIRKIIQKGGFLTALLPPVLTVLGSLLMK